VTGVATVAENLATAKANYAAKLAEISADPKPTYSVNGRSISWGEYHKMLLDMISSITDAEQKVAGPIMVVSRGKS
jgi:hypothetical protein